MRVTQVLVGAAPGDAITAAAVEIDRLLAPVADTAILAHHIDPAVHLDPAVAGLIQPFDAPGPWSGATADDLVILHVSIGDPELFAWLRTRPERLVLVHHNISPAEAFAETAPDFAELLRLGRSELPALLARSTMVLADSAYNAAELDALGATDVRVCPLVFDPLSLTRLAPDRDTVAFGGGLSAGPVVLYVGQLLPHKRVDWLLEAYFILVTYLVPEAHLIIVGNAPLPAHRRHLQTYIDQLNLNRAHVTGRVSAAALASYYRRADVLATASEHEGFCAPLLEAMAFGVPIVARAFGAIAETLGGAGLVVADDDGPAVFAEALATVVGDGAAPLRGELVRRGHDRLDAIGPDVARSQLRRHLGELVAGLGSPGVEAPDAAAPAGTA